MKEFKINDKVFNVPEKWGDIKLGHFETFLNDAPRDRKERVEYVAKICKCDAADLFEIPAEVFEQMLEVLAFVFDEWRVTPSANIEIDGVKYGVNSEERLTLGEWIDTEEAQGGENPISGALAVVCRPIGEPYDANATDAREKMFAALPVSQVLPLISFFHKRKIAFETHSRAYSIISEYRRTVPSSTEILRNVGDGIRPSTIWQTVRFLITIAFLRRRLARFCSN